MGKMQTNIKRRRSTLPLSFHFNRVRMSEDVGQCQSFLRLNTTIEWTTDIFSIVPFVSYANDENFLIFRSRVLYYGHVETF